jgi:transaldolase/glucose-6-phosphate isomerase
MKVGIAADHGGFDLKGKMAAFVEEQGYTIVDYGAYHYDKHDDYPDFVVPLAKAVASGEVDRGIAICGSGVGASIVANKIPGARAALITETYSAHQGVEHDDMNIICLGGRVIGSVLVEEIIKSYLKAAYTGEDRHQRRLNKVIALESKEETMKTNPLVNVYSFRQSIWMDFIRRGILSSGELKTMIAEYGLKGITSNPSIFEEAINGSTDYSTAIQELVRQNKNTDEIYETLAVEDIQNASDMFRNIYEETNAIDGYVSLEVSPYLAKDTNGTITEGKKLWAAVNRPNVMIKVPGTQEGLPAIQQLISEGINVNVTLLFGLERYRAVANAYITGLEHRLKNKQPLDNIASVASFFLSRIDVMIDPQLEKIAAAGGPNAAVAKSLLGKVAIANAKMSYQIYKELFNSPRFRTLAEKGARPQRLLWASTGTKNPNYSPVMYIEHLIGPDTVNTVPLETLKAYNAQGQPASRLEEGLEDAKKVLTDLASLGIVLDDITEKLEVEGVEKFNKPFAKLMEALENKRKEALSSVK